MEATDNPQQRHQHDQIAQQVQIDQKDRLRNLRTRTEAPEAEQACDQPPQWVKAAAQRVQTFIVMFHGSPGA
jgi:hypothetical protein